ncbi:DUF896 domain-containing protein [Terrilactibacillus sp. BCM23-1]|uniref:UPF0291 protein GMB86_14975 n=1 Tax=Terrilactibacillus tamarindi TaxID=2599694 RepID=A0A6N8CTA7_9BACI|nr:DUF896 domain-containing protein [Terrilactibacillus tamarindi]MTT33301.1 DUF896 domain-containing protein [Terrilactibacillus tamarindi]
MLAKEKLKRISELSKKSKLEGLTKEEKKEQQSLREEYLKAFRKGFRDHLHTIKVVDEEGTDVTPLKLKQSKERRSKN